MEQGMGTDGKGTGQKPVSKQQCCPCSLPARARAKISTTNAGHGALAVGAALTLPSCGTIPGALLSSRRRARNNWEWDTEMLQSSLTLQQWRGVVMQVHAPLPRVAVGHHETMAGGLCDWEMCPNSV